MPYHIVATEGATTDGRVISGLHLEQMAKNYNPEKYNARIWMEHIRGLYPDSDFAALGDVEALATQKNSEGKIQLLAKIKPLEELKRITSKGQKLYSSIEMDTNFAQSGEAYLVGLAVTDSPASLGTSRLAFSSRQPGTTEIYSSYSELQSVALSTAPAAPTAANPVEQKLDQLITLFSAQFAATPPPSSTTTPTSSQLEILSQTLQQLTGRLDLLAQQPQPGGRPVATGSATAHEIDY